MKQEFKVGDKVYYPSQKPQIYTLKENSGSMYSVAIEDTFYRATFTSKGGAYSDSLLPSIFHATEENYRKLSELYGVEFEAPPKRKTSQEVVQAMLNDGWDSVPCYVSDDDEATAIRNGIKSLIDMGSIDSWDFCVPFCNRTGKRIIDYIDGEIVTE